MDVDRPNRPMRGLIIASRLAVRRRSLVTVSDRRVNSGPAALASALVTLILTIGLALCDTACASTKRSSGLALRSIGLSSSQRRNPPKAIMSKPRDAVAGVGVPASERIETGDTVATNKVRASASTAGAGTMAGTTSSQSPSMTVTTITTQPPIDTEVEQISRSLWLFLIGFAYTGSGCESRDTPHP